MIPMETSAAMMRFTFVSLSVVVAVPVFGQVTDGRVTGVAP